MDSSLDETVPSSEVTPSTDTPPNKETDQTPSVEPDEQTDEVPVKTKPDNDQTQDNPTPSDSHVVPYNDEGVCPWTTLSKAELIDKIKGIIYGQAIGDAIGLATEFYAKKQCIQIYSKQGPKSYNDIIQDGHRSRWDKGDWTDDTDQMLLIMLSITDNNGEVKERDFGGRLHNWMLHGFEELGDPGGFGIGMTVGRVLRHQLFKSDPHAAAREVWEQSGRYLAANGAVMRTSILGVLNFNDIPKVIDNTISISRVTHADPRCTASCVAVTTAIALMLQGKYDLTKDKDTQKLIEESYEHAVKYIELPAQTKELKQFMNTKNLKELKLDDKQAIGYTFKAMGCGFWGLRKGPDFRKLIIELIMEGGDADTNASVCGAMLGCKVGFSSLPTDLLEFPHRQWLDNHVDRFLQTIGLV